jgi:GNAT superfamily N-acetyltransferase
VTLRPERAGDEALLYRLFCSWALEDLEGMPVDDATKENLLRFQFAGQMMTYRANFPTASFDIIEHDGAPVGRLIVDPGDAREPACLVDFVLLPETRNNRLGRAIISAVLAEQAALGRKVRVKILHHNEPSQRMCTALGFVEVDRDPPFVQMEWTAPSTA